MTLPFWLSSRGFRRVLHIDLETFSTRKIGKTDSVGVYKYVECAQFTIQLAAFRWDDYDVEQIDYMKGQDLDDETYYALNDPTVLKVAHNAPFELVCLSEYYEIELDPAQWYCTMVGAAMLGLPFGLGDIAMVLRLDNQKEQRGQQLIDLFAKPCKPTKANGQRTQNLPHQLPEEWEEYKQYNRQDVWTECDVFDYLMSMPEQPDVERDYWIMDYHINRRGFLIDLHYARQALKINDRAAAKAAIDIRTLTGVKNPNSPPQIKKWMLEQTGEVFPSLAADIVEDLLAAEDLPDHVLDYLELRQISGKTSVAKYGKMQAWATRDRRNHGAIQHYGASRTGRFAGRGSQPHNMARTLEPDDLEKEFGVRDIAKLRQMIRDDKLPKGIHNIANLIKVMVRCAVIAPDGSMLVPNDYNAIEARVLAWLAGEEWRLDLFKEGTRDMYMASYSGMFGVAYAAVTKDQRQTGKVAELALGFGGAEGAIATSDKKKKIPAGDRKRVVKAWRSANKNIVKTWWKVESAAKQAIEERRTVKLKLPYCTLTFKYYKGYLHIYLPSGRYLSYYGARVIDGSITFKGAKGEKGGWAMNDTYGGSLVENIVQAIARDILCDGLLRMHRAGIDIVLHVHDEAVAEAKKEEAEKTLKQMSDIMAVLPLWAKGLPMKSSGFVSPFYKKD